MTLKRDIRHALRLDAEALFDLVHAVLALAIARMRLSTQKTQELLSSTNRPCSQPPPGDANSLIDRVAFAVPRMGARVPWRADCLVQALAAQRWLDRHRVETRVVIGVRKGGPSNLDAHAWLMAGDRVVTGGEVDAYQVILKQPMHSKANALRGH